MKTFKLHRSRIVHQPITVGCTIRSGSDSGLFLKVVEIIPGDYPVVREMTEWDKDKQVYNSVGKETNWYDRLVVETYAHVKCGLIKLSKKPIRRQGYISSYSPENAQIETTPGADHTHWGYERADAVVIKLTTDQAYEQGRRKRIVNEQYWKNKVKSHANHVKWAKENNRKVHNPEPNYESTMADRLKWDNPYHFDGYPTELAKAWIKGHNAE